MSLFFLCSFAFILFFSTFLSCLKHNGAVALTLPQLPPLLLFRAFSLFSTLNSSSFLSHFLINLLTVALNSLSLCCCFSVFQFQMKTGNSRRRGWCKEDEEEEKKGNRWWVWGGSKNKRQTWWKFKFPTFFFCFSKALSLPHSRKLFLPGRGKSSHLSACSSWENNCVIRIAGRKERGIWNFSLFFLCWRYTLSHQAWGFLSRWAR